MTLSTPSHPASEVFDDSATESISVRHFVNTLSIYRPVILLGLVAVGIAYSLVALMIFLSAPVERVTAQPFRLDFDGAASGRFPNGLRFSPSDIVNPTLLVQTYQRNDLSRYVSF